MIQTLTDLIIRPPRSRYNPNTDLGPVNFSIDGKYLGTRVDFKVTNRRNLVLECSFFHRKCENSKKYPLMIYCHGNTGNRTNSYDTVCSMLCSKVNVITFDFAGCGLSEGKTISLGYFEQDDIDDVLEYAIQTFECIDTNRIGIWGRCMGAVSAIMFASQTSCISLLVLDTPFSDFVSLIRDYIERVKIIPKWAEEYIYTNIRTKIKEQAGFDFEDIVPIQKVTKCRVPALFVHGVNDGIIPSHIFKKIYDAYPAAKEYIELKTSHNDARPDSTYEKIASFVKAKFFPPLAYGRFGPTPKNSKAKPKLISGFTLVSLDTIRFNQNTADSNEEGMTAMQNVLGSIGRDKNEDLRSFPDLDENLIDKLSQSKPKKNQLNTFASFLSDINETDGQPRNVKVFKTPTLHKARTEPQHMLERKLQSKIIEEEETEGDISDALLDSGKISNKDYLEVSYIENAAKSTFDSFRQKKRRSFSNTAKEKGL